MKICPVAIAIGCRKCPIFTPCPAKGFIGDYVKEVAALPQRAAAAAKQPKPAAGAGTAKRMASRGKRTGKSRARKPK